MRFRKVGQRFQFELFPMDTREPDQTFGSWRNMQHGLFDQTIQLLPREISVRRESRKVQPPRGTKPGTKRREYRFMAAALHLCEICEPLRARAAARGGKDIDYAA